MLKQARDALVELSDDPKARARAEMRELALISEQLYLRTARQEGLAEGRVEGLVEALLVLLQGRGLVVSDSQREEIKACRDRALLTHWLERALVVDSVASLLAERT